MPRKRRLLGKDIFYHVFNRGINKKNIQFSTHFQDLFFHQLKLSIVKSKVEIHAFCLMENHYHLIVRTPDANLDYFMQHFGAGLSRKVNYITGGDGALFRSRYRSIVIESEIYLLQLMKYIHRNPVEAKIVDLPENYSLSSYAAYIDEPTPNGWLKTDFLKAMFNNTEAIKQFHETPIPPRIAKLYSQKQLPSVI